MGARRLAHCARARWSVGRIVAASALIGACGRPAPAGQQATGAPADAGTAQTAHGRSERAYPFDALVTSELLFALSDRARIERKEADDPRGTRAYSFSLRSEPGMAPHRHFFLLTVLVTAAGGPSVPVAAPIAGPGGSFLERRGLSEDGAYEVVVRLGSLLPERVPMPAITLEGALDAILQGYRRRHGPR
jgi:hypothetical protein